MSLLIDYDDMLMMKLCCVCGPLTKKMTTWGQNQGWND